MFQGGKVIQYYFFYPYSEYQSDTWYKEIAGEIGQHESDWEMVQFFVSGDRYYFPVVSGYAQHYIGRVSHWTKQQKNGITPEVYPAEKGHASYYTAGYHDSFYEGEFNRDGSKTTGTGDEATGDARELEPSQYNLVSIEDQEWVDWNGQWSDGHPGPDMKKDFYDTNVWHNPSEWMNRRTPYRQGADEEDYNPPSASLNKPKEVNPEEEVTFNGLGSDEQSYLEYHWDIGNGSYKITKDSDLTYSFNEGGDYNIELAVVDNEGASATEEILYHVNQFPNPEFTFLQETVKTFEEIGVEESSSDPDGLITSRTWSFGTKQAEGSNPQISFEDDGDYEVALTVEDDDGLEKELRKTVEVLNRKPEARFSIEPKEIYYDTEVRIQSQSTDRDGSIVETEWSIDGETVKNTKTLQETFSDATGGVSNYEVALKVEDDDGSTDTQSKTIDIANRKPKADFEVNTTEVKVGENISLISNPKDEDGSITDITWDLDNGETSKEEELVHNYDEPGTYEVSLTVVDSADEKSSMSKEVEVSGRGVSSYIGKIIDSILGVFS
jgi:PKD repeat protein